MYEPLLLERIRNLEARTELLEEMVHVTIDGMEDKYGEVLEITKRIIAERGEKSAEEQTESPEEPNDEAGN